MTRKECLDKAAECVLQDRQDQYGDVEDCFKKIARLWNAYLPSTIELEPFDVACMMALLKIARIQANPKHGDSWVDLAGYAACGAGIAVPEPFRYDKPETESGCFQNRNGHSPEEPKFKRGDKVEVQMVPDSSTWASATIMAVYRDKDTCEWRYCVDFEDGWAHLVVPSARVRPVSGIKAEGCEELVEKDAPQTKEELCQRIVDCNPSVYPRKPTGEELAEMAEEGEKHG